MQQAQKHYTPFPKFRFIPAYNTHTSTARNGRHQGAFFVNGSDAVLLIRHFARDRLIYYICRGVEFVTIPIAYTKSHVHRQGAD
jgi:hypothetical protein